MMAVEGSGDVDILNDEVSSGMYEAATESVPRSKGKMRRKTVPWWTEQCSNAVKDRNKAFRTLKRTHNFQNLIQYKKAQAIVRRTIRQAKRKSWQAFCEKIGRSTPVGEVWGMVKKMGGDRREWFYPVLKENDIIAVADKDKAETMVEGVCESSQLRQLVRGRKERKGTDHERA